MRRVETMCTSKLLKTNKYMNKNRSEISQIKFKNTIQLKPKKKTKNNQHSHTINSNPDLCHP